MIPLLLASLLFQGDEGATASGLPRDLGDFDRQASILPAMPEAIDVLPSPAVRARYWLGDVPAYLCSSAELLSARPGREKSLVAPLDPQGEPSQEPPGVPAPHDSFTGFFETHFSSRAWKEYVWDDYLTQTSVLLPAGLALSAIIIHPWDKRLEAQWHGLLGGKETYSNVSQDILIGSAILIGILLPGEGRNSWDEFWTIGESFAASSLTVAVLKTAVGRPRPGNTPGTSVGNQSFPSGHASGAFTSATLIDRNSGPLLGVPAYLLAGFTAFERVEAGRHYPSDVLAGAAIGALSAGIFDSLHWGKGPGRGIAGVLADTRVSFLDGLHGFELEWGCRF